MPSKGLPLSSIADPCPEQSFSHLQFLSAHLTGKLFGWGRNKVSGKVVALDCGARFCRVALSGSILLLTNRLLSCLCSEWSLLGKCNKPFKPAAILARLHMWCCSHLAQGAKCFIKLHIPKPLLTGFSTVPHDTLACLSDMPGHSWDISPIQLIKWQTWECLQLAVT